MKITGKDLRLLLLGLCFLGFLFWFSLANLQLAQDPVDHFLSGSTGFSAARDQLQENYTSDELLHKTDFVNLSGLYARLTGRQLHNDIYRTKNGMLTLVMEQQDMTPLGNNLIEFSQDLASLEVPFLYVQAPYKEDYADSILPQGVSSYANENADALLSQLQAANVTTYDLRPHISATRELIDAYYFRTDHHWNIDGAFLGFQLIAGKLDEMLPGPGLDLGYTDKTLWQRHLREDWFLGSRGKRVGICFNGVDDYAWLTPTFPTQMRMAIESRGEVRSGDFAKAVLRPENVDKKDYFGINVYCNYIGGDYPLVRHSNSQAPNPQKILIIKDSYSLPVQAFLSTLFREVEVIDPRYYPNYDITRYIQNSPPDLVLMLMNPSAFPYKEYMDFGDLDPAFANLRPMKAPAGDITLPEENTVNLGYGRVYQLQFSDFIPTDPEITETMVAVIPEGSSKPTQYQIFDLAQCREAGEFTWRFTTPRYGSTRLKLVFLSGKSLYGGGVYQNVTLSTAAYQ